MTVLGSVNPDSSWQAKAHQGFEVADFKIDWDAHTATCPQGRPSTLWMPAALAHQISLRRNLSQMRNLGRPLRVQNNDLFFSSTINRLEHSAIQSGKVSNGPCA